MTAEAPLNQEFQTCHEEHLQTKAQKSGQRCFDMKCFYESFHKSLGEQI